MNTKVKTFSRFSKPNVGATVQVTTKYRSVVAGEDYTINSYKGKVLRSMPWDHTNTFRMTGGIIGFDVELPVRVIPLQHVTDLEIDGAKQKTTSYKSGTHVVTIKGSKGDPYEVVVEDGRVTHCPCTGFGFRKWCSHGKKALADLQKGDAC